MENVLIAIKEADLTGITNELKKINNELVRIKSNQANKALNIKEVCELMGWSLTTFERMRRNKTLPLPAYKMAGVKVNYFDLIDWRNKWQLLDKQGKI